jgi:putative oligomerization/nucleic acid binding protein
MGLFSFLRRKDERAIPEPGTPEFDAVVQGSALPDPQSVSMGEPGWSQAGSEVEQPNQPTDSSNVHRLEGILRALGQAGLQIPNAGGFGGGISAPEQDPLDQVEHLARQRDAGQITDAEFEAQKKQLLGGD